MRFGITPVGGSPVGIVEGSTPGGRNDIFAGRKVKNCLQLLEMKNLVTVGSHFLEVT